MIMFLLMMVMPKQRMIQTLTDKLNSITRESLTGIRVVRAYNAEDYQDAKFAQANDNVTNLNPLYWTFNGVVISSNDRNFKRNDTCYLLDWCAFD